MNMSLFKVPWPLTYRSLPSLPSERLCFPRGPCSGFHCLANKATLHFSHKSSGGRGKETRHCACMTYLQLTFKRVHKSVCICVSLCMCTEAFCEVLRCLFTCVRTCNCVRALKQGRKIENLRASKQEKTYRFPICGIFLSVLDLVLNAHPARPDVCRGRGLPVDHDIKT